MVKLLLENGAELEKEDKNGQTPLSWAAENGHEAIVKLLLKNGAEVEKEDINGRKPLWWAAGNGHKAVVQLLLDQVWSDAIERVTALALAELARTLRLRD